MEKKISYLARNFEDIKSELLSFSKKYYPELSDSFDDASVGAWLIDLMSAVGDDLSYHTDRMYQETNIDSASSKNTILNNARMNGIKIPGPKSSVCEVELSCTLDVSPETISQPDYTEAPSIKRGGVVGNSNFTFELTEDVNFAEQFNSDGYSNRKIEPIKNTNGNITGYKITKSTIVVGGKSKIYKKVISEEDLTPFMEIILPEQNIMNIESIIFKETANFSVDPENYEFFIDEEEYKVKDESISTYRYFEVNSLADQYRFGTKTNLDSTTLTVDDSNPEVYVDFNNIARYYEGEWKPITQKFITEYTDNGYLKIIFGNGTDTVDTPINSTTYGKAVMSRIINNRMLGLLPRAGWTMFVLYRVGGGLETNLGVGAINTIMNLDVSFPNLDTTKNVNTIQNNIINSLTVTNITPSVAGKDAPSTEEMKYLVKYTIPSQERCVTLKDYKSRIMLMPPKYGCPFRCNVLEENNKIVIPLLGLTSEKTLDNTLPDVLVSNLIEYLSNYKNITDYVEFKSGKIYNIGFEVDVFINKNYTTSDVILSIINKITEYFSVEKHDMGEDIFIGDLERELNTLDGVISLIDLKVYKIWNGDYSKTPCPLPTVNYTSNCAIINSSFKIDNASVEQIDLNSTDSVLYSDYDSMYEILKPNKDIQIKVKLR